MVVAFYSKQFGLGWVQNLVAGAAEGFSAVVGLFF